MARAVTTAELKAKDSASTTYDKFSKNSSKSLKKIEGNMQQLGQTAKTVGVGIAVAIGTQAVGAIKQLAMETSALGVETVRMRASSDALAKSMGKNYVAMVDAARRGSENLVGEFAAMREINKGLLLDLPITAENMDDVARISTALGRAMGRTADEALADLITGLGRGSALILDNIGIVIDQTKVLDDYANQLGVTRKELTKTEEKQAIFNSAIIAANEKVSAMGNIQKDISTDVDALTASWEDLKRTVSETLVENVWFGKAIEGAQWWVDAFGKVFGIVEKTNPLIERITSEAQKQLDIENAIMQRKINQAVAAEKIAFSKRKEVEELQKQIELEEFLGSFTKDISGGGEFVKFVEPETPDVNQSKLEEHDLNTLLIDDYTSLNEAKMRENEATWTQIQLAEQEKKSKQQLAVSLIKTAATTLGIQSKYLAPIEIFLAIKEAADSIGAFARYDYMAGALHAQSSLQHIAAAKQLGKSGGGGASLSRGGGTARATPQSARGNPYDRPELESNLQNPTIIVNNTMDDNGFSSFVQTRAVNGIVSDAQNGGMSATVLQDVIMGPG